MTRHVLTVRLKDEPGVVETYARHHREVWPDVQASLRQCGVEQMDIYLLGRTLVMILEMRNGVDYRTAFASHASSSARVAEWEELMKSLQEPCVGARAGEWWAIMEPVFHLNPDIAEDPAIAYVADQSRTS
ncbi:MAG TPA: L-rhamnose mutarotase [Vicinamibacterales bacterium]|nr:L-rhamnose mutarotase [Vicinamibacterales bacterium]